jgi:hypothetical protein
MMDLRTASEYVGYSYWTLRDLVLNGHVPAVRIPSPRANDGRALRRTLIDARDLDTLIEEWKEVNNADTLPSAVRRITVKRSERRNLNGNDLQRGAVWWIKYYRNGQPMRESTRSAMEGDAKSLLKKREGDIESGLPVSPKLSRIRFDEAADDLETEYEVNGRRSADELERRIRLHLVPHFSGRRLVAITTADVNAFILKRQRDVIVTSEGDDRKERRFSNGEINRELTTLKRIFNLARQNGKLMHVPHIPMLKEGNTRTGFFEREQVDQLVRHLPPAVRPVVQFAYITGWRVPSEVLPLQWRHVDFEARVVRLDPYTTKNDDGRLPLHGCAPSAPGCPEGRARCASGRGRALPMGLPPHGQEGKRQTDPSVHQSVEKGVRRCGMSRPNSTRPSTNSRAQPRSRRHSRTGGDADTGHKTRSVFERYNIVSEGDLVDAAKNWTPPIRRSA